MHREIVRILVLLKASVLAKAAPLFVQLAKVSPNTVLPIIKFQTALMAEHKKQPIQKGLMAGTKVDSAWQLVVPLSGCSSLITVSLLNLKRRGRSASEGHHETH